VRAQALALLLLLLQQQQLVLLWCRIEGWAGELVQPVPGRQTSRRRPQCYRCCIKPCTGTAVVVAQQASDASVVCRLSRDSAPLETASSPRGGKGSRQQTCRLSSRRGRRRRKGGVERGIRSPLPAAAVRRRRVKVSAVPRSRLCWTRDAIAAGIAACPGRGVRQGRPSPLQRLHRPPRCTAGAPR